MALQGVLIALALVKPDLWWIAGVAAARPEGDDRLLVGQPYGVVLVGIARVERPVSPVRSCRWLPTDWWQIALFLLIG